MTRRHWPSAIVGILSLCTGLSCGNERVTAPPPAPVPGTLLVSLEPPGAPAGAVLVLLTGRGITTALKAGATEHLFVHALDSTAVRVAVVGERVSGALFSFRVPDVTRFDAYSATLLQVADEANALLPDLGGYRLSVSEE